MDCDTEKKRKITLFLSRSSIQGSFTSLNTTRTKKNERERENGEEKTIVLSNTYPNGCFSFFSFFFFLNDTMIRYIF